MQRSIQFIWWLYPVLCLFWPGELNCRRFKKKKRSGFSSSLYNNKNNSRKQTLNADGTAINNHEEDDDGSESEYDASSISYVNLN